MAAFKKILVVLLPEGTYGRLCLSWALPGWGRGGVECGEMGECQDASECERELSKRGSSARR